MRAYILTKVQIVTVSMMSLLAASSAFASSAETLIRANLNRVVVLKNVIAGTDCAAKGVVAYDYEGDRGHLELQVNYFANTVRPGDETYAGYQFKTLLFRDSIRFSQSYSDFVFFERTKDLEVTVDYSGNRITRIVKKVNDEIQEDCR